MEVEKRENIYFASDFHLGAPKGEESKLREQHIVKWLDEISKDAKEIYLVGDIFDFWFEYKHVVPKGFIRLQGKIIALIDLGIKVHLFTGNHDMWMFDYLPSELGVQLHRKPIVKTFFGKKVMIGHGDGLGPKDYIYKFLKRIFANKLCQFLFARLHPNLGMGIGNCWSRKSRKNNTDKVFVNESEEWLVSYCKDYLATEGHLDYFIFGHRHLPLEIKLNDNSTYFNLGEWITDYTYLVLTKKGAVLKKYKTT